MGEKTGIAWTDHTFNPWWGCVKVSPACTNCYAETFDARFAGDKPHWGVNSPRKFFTDKHWNEPRKWNKAAQAACKPARVFCASMADVFEDREDLVSSRQRLWQLIEATPWLYWLLLTKRPENIERMLPKPLVTAQMAAKHGGTVQPFFQNVWLGTTVENQRYADERIPHLLSVPASVHFLSCEPLLGPIDLTRVREQLAENSYQITSALEGDDGFGLSAARARVDWVIAGCESGHGARRVELDWYRGLRDQCATSDVSFFLKQAEPWDEGRTTAGLVDVARGISIGKGSWSKGQIIEQPYLDGVQHLSFPKGYLDQ